jgi:hypothetical protein
MHGQQNIKILRSAEQPEPTPLEVTVTIPINPALENELWHLEVANDFVGRKPQGSISAST